MPESVAISVTVNGRRTDLSVEPRRILADVLRDELGLRSIHLGCEEGACGACMVLVEGDPAPACMMLAVQAHEREVQTLEGLIDTEPMSTLQAAFHEHHGLQCGYCTPGMLVSLYGVICSPEPPQADAIRERLRGNLCRCTGYQGIVAATLAAAAVSIPVEGAEQR